MSALAERILAAVEDAARVDENEIPAEHTIRGCAVLNRDEVLAAIDAALNEGRCDVQVHASIGDAGRVGAAFVRAGRTLTLEVPYGNLAGLGPFDVITLNWPKPSDPKLAEWECVEVRTRLAPGGVIRRGEGRS